MSILTADPAVRHAPDYYSGDHRVDWMTRVSQRRLANASQTPLDQLGECTLTIDEYRRRWVTGRFIAPVAVEPEPEAEAPRPRLSPSAMIAARLAA